MDWFWSRFGRTTPQSISNFRFDTPGALALFNMRLAAYARARNLAAARPQVATGGPGLMDLRSKVSTQEDLESRWAGFWLRELKLAFVYHRKLWELAYVMQALNQTGCLSPGKTGVGFGCGREILPSYFASRGLRILATDMPRSAERASAWKATNQHSESMADLYFPDLCSADKFHTQVSWRDVDMNHLPADLGLFDFCWSICAIEHLGSIEQATDFVERALGYLVPGGIAVHTTEFAFLSRDRPFEKSSTVLFTRSDLRALDRRLANAGHNLAPIDFNPGEGPMDIFIDGPPYWHAQEGLPDNIHLKATYEGVPTTCFGMIVRKAA